MIRGGSISYGLVQTIQELPTPALLLDADRLEANLRGMADRARAR